MIPNHKISRVPVESEYLYENYEEDLLYLQPGGADIQNTSESNTFQMWEMYYEEGSIKLKSLTNNKFYTIKTVDNVRELSFSFTNNMYLVYSYKINETNYLNYYNATSQRNEEIIIPDAAYVKVIYDDYRTTQSNAADVLIFYINTKLGKLCYRIERDRYNNEYQLANVHPKNRLVRVGMTNNYRLKFQIQGYD